MQGTIFHHRRITKLVWVIELLLKNSLANEDAPVKKKKKKSPRKRIVVRTANQVSGSTDERAGSDGKSLISEKDQREL